MKRLSHNRPVTKRPRQTTRRGTSLVPKRPLSPRLSAKATKLPGVRGDLAYRRFHRFTVARRRRHSTELRSSHRGCEIAAVQVYQRSAAPAMETANEK